MNSFRKLQIAARALVLLSLLVILWGAWVRLSGSGDGCGDHWPLCQGQVIPDTLQSAPAALTSGSQKTWTEYLHRLTSGLYGIAVLILTVFIFRRTPKKHPARLWAGLGFFFMVTEALLGAQLVLLRLVGTNESPLRAGAMGLHLINSMLLVGTGTLAAEFLGHEDWQRRIQWPVLQSGKSLKKFLISLGIGFLVLNLSGAVAALSTTIFPANNFLESWQNQQDSTHYLYSFRSIHPFLGFFLGVGFASFALILSNLAQVPVVKDRSRTFALTALAAVSVGSVTLLLASPWMLKLTHLMCAYALLVSALRLVLVLMYEPKTAQT